MKFAYVDNRLTPIRKYNQNHDAKGEFSSGGDSGKDKGAGPVDKKGNPIRVGHTVTVAHTDAPRGYHSSTITRVNPSEI